MSSDSGQPHQSSFDTSELSVMLAELWNDWFETMSDVAYQTHRACEFFLEKGGSPNRQHGPFDSPPWRSPSEGPSGSIDMDKLRLCLQAMEPMQAARVIHAVQMMQAMEAMLKRKRSRASEAHGTPW